MGESADRKVALLVMDGLALDQWVVVRTVLADQRPGWRFREDGLFAWHPHADHGLAAGLFRFRGAAASVLPDS